MAAKKNYYVVKNGRKNGLFSTWKECHEQIHGFSGAVYKGFVNLDEAEAYLAGSEHKDSEGHNSEDEVLKGINENEMIAYVDGSNLGDGSAFSWGIVTFSNELGKVELSGMSDNENYIKHRNVAGELFASVHATKFAIKNKMKKITIYHDYVGIKHWALGEWKTNNSLSSYYKSFFEKARKEIDVDFVKVKGHSGDRFNEEADKLAKKALDIE